MHSEFRISANLEWILFRLRSIFTDLIEFCNICLMIFFEKCLVWEILEVIFWKKIQNRIIAVTLSTLEPYKSFKIHQIWTKKSFLCVETPCLWLPIDFFKNFYQKSVGLCERFLVILGLCAAITVFFIVLIWLVLMIKLLFVVANCS